MNWHDCCSIYIPYLLNLNFTMEKKSIELLSKIVVWDKYARYLPKEKRRESFEEICDRYESFMINKFPETKEQTKWAMSFVRQKKVLPSMRMLQFAGDAVAVNESRGYNCSYIPVNDPKAFSETMFLLLGGTGVGFSVERHQINKLPTVKKICVDNPDVHPQRFVIHDSFKGGPIQ